MMFKLPKERIVSSKGPLDAAKAWFSHGFVEGGHCEILDHLFQTLWVPLMEAKAEAFAVVQSRASGDGMIWWLEPSPEAIALMQRVDEHYLRALIRQRTPRCAHYLRAELESLDQSCAHHRMLYKQCAPAMDEIRRKHVLSDEHIVKAVRVAIVCLKGEFVGKYIQPIVADGGRDQTHFERAEQFLQIQERNLRGAYAQSFESRGVDRLIALFRRKVGQRLRRLCQGIERRELAGESRHSVSGKLAIYFASRMDEGVCLRGPRP